MASAVNFSRTNSRFLLSLSLSDRLGLTPHSKVWVGAWWIGFVFMAAFCLLLAVPILAYPPALPGSEKLQKVSEAHRGGDDGDGERSQETFTKIKQIPRALLALLRNPTFFFLNLAGASEGLVISGFAVFLPKLIENQFSVTAVWSALLMGKCDRFGMSLVFSREDSFLFVRRNVFMIYYIEGRYLLNQL